MLAVSASVVLFYFFNDPAGSSFGIPCLLHTTTGWNCWGCGGQRAFYHMLHGHFGAALAYNALVFPVTLLCGYVLFSELAQIRNPYRFLRNTTIQLCSLTVLIGFTVLRNIFG